MKQPILKKKIIIKKKLGGIKTAGGFSSPTPDGESSVPTAAPGKATPVPSSPLDLMAPEMAGPRPGLSVVADTPKAGADEVVKFYCIRCGQKLSIRRNLCGSEVTCPRCSNLITVPEPLSN